MNKIKSKIKDIMMHTWFGVHFIEPIYKLWSYLWRYRPWVDDETRIKQIFKKKFGYNLDLDDPKTFNEKINWLKIHNRTELHVICSDKIRMREYVKEKIGSEYVVPLIFTSCDTNDININKLPNKPVVIKTNHDSGTVYLINNKYESNLRKIRNGIHFGMKKNLYWYAREWNYKRIDPKILVEDMLGKDSPGKLKDYKIFCANGEPKFIQVDNDRFINHKRNLYDIQWNFIDVMYKCENFEIEEKPKEIDKMIVLSRKLSEPFNFSRIDMYIYENKIYVGEITFFPEAGLTEFYPDKYNIFFGDMIKI